MKLDKETPGTFRYRAVKDTAPVPMVYIKRQYFTQAPPKKIILTIEENYANS
jgi:hypothetical protein